MAIKSSNINWNMIIAITSVILAGAAVVSLILAIQKCSTGKKLSHQHVKPDISVSIEYPIKVEEDKAYRNTRNPDIIIRNNGPIKAVALSGDIKIYIYDTEQEEIANYVDVGFQGFDHVMSTKELEPFDQIKHSTVGVKGKKLIAAYLINIVFHRESDSEQFSLKEYFFTQDKVIFTNDQFKINKHYYKILEKIKDYDPAKDEKHEFSFTATDANTWFVESESMHKARKTQDGKLRIIGDPTAQSEEPTPGLPHLIIVPIKFEDCDCFIEVEIDEDHIAAKVRYVLRNIGDITAGLTKNGFDVVEELEPGEESVYTLPLRLPKAPEDNRPIQDVFNDLTSNISSITIPLFFLYRPKSDPNRLFKATVTFKFMRDKVEISEVE